MRISVGCQSWTIGPRLALLWRPRFGDHSWANCGIFDFTNSGSQHRQPKMCLTVGSTMAQSQTDLSGQPWRITLDDRDSSVGPPLGHGSWTSCGSFSFTNFGSQYRQPKMCPTVGSTMAQTRTDCRANYGPDSNRLSGQTWRITLDDRDSLVGPPLGHG